MSSRRVVLAGLAAWLAVVTVGSVMVWAVVGRVGQHLEASDEPVVGAASTAVAVVTPAGEQRHPHHSASSKPSRSPSVGPSSAPPSTSGPTSTASSHPVTQHPSSTHSSNPSGGHSSSPSQPSSSAGSPSPQAQRRTWYGEPGLLTAECRSTSVSLVAAQPGSGYKVEIEERGPGRVLVKFEGTTDGHEGEWQVAARCVGGIPAFSVSAGED